MFQDIREVVLVGTLILGLTSGIFSVILVLKSQAMLGEVLAQATYPGVVLTFIFTQSTQLSHLIVGAMIANGVAIVLTNALLTTSNLKTDAIFALVLSSFFGIGRFFVSLFARQPGFGQISRLDDFLFGSAATIVEGDVNAIIFVSIICVLFLIITYPYLKIIIFDAVYAKSVMNNTKIIDFFLLVVLSLVIVVGARLVGIILMIALLVIPALIARQWSTHFLHNILIAGMIGALVTFIGVYISFEMVNTPTGPIIVVVAFTILVGSFICQHLIMWYKKLKTNNTKLVDDHSGALHE